MATKALASASKAGAAGFSGTAGRYRLSAGMAVGGRPLLVVAVPARAPSPSPDAVAERYELTPRQAEVAVLLAERYSNKEVAEALSVSVHTARHHVEAVLGRLGIPRAEVGGLL